MIHTERLKAFLYVFVACSVGSQRQTQSLAFSIDLRPVFEKVKFDVRHSLKPFKDLDGRFDPSSTALTKRSPAVLVSLCILSAGL